MRIDPRVSLISQPALASIFLSRDPLAHVWIALYQRDAIRFALSEKIDAVLTRQSHISEVKNDRPTACFRPD